MTLALESYDLIDEAADEACHLLGSEFYDIKLDRTEVVASLRADVEAGAPIPNEDDIDLLVSSDTDEELEDWAPLLVGLYPRFLDYIRKFTA